jgi:hypothetical protein
MLKKLWLPNLLLIRQLRRHKQGISKPKKPLAEVSKKQTQCEEAVVKRIYDVLTSFGSKYRLTVASLVLL